MINTRRIIMENEFNPERTGKITASNLYKIISTDKPMSQTAKSYLNDVFSQRFIESELIEETIWNNSGSRSTQWGKDLEKEAINYFNLINADKNLVASQNKAFSYNNEIKFGATTDALIENLHTGTTHCMEVKCPFNYSKQIHRFYSQIQKEYYWQCIGQMIVLPKVKSCYFVSYDPRYKKDYRLYIKEIKREECLDDFDKAIQSIKIANEYIDSLNKKLIG
jgi:hypothetical protein